MLTGTPLIRTRKLHVASCRCKVALLLTARRRGLLFNTYQGHASLRRRFPEATILSICDASVSPPHADSATVTAEFPAENQEDEADPEDDAAQPPENVNQLLNIAYRRRDGYVLSVKANFLVRKRPCLPRVLRVCSKLLLC